MSQGAAPGAGAGRGGGAWGEPRKPGARRSPEGPSRTILLDAYNVILRSPAFRPDEHRDLAAARTRLINLLSWAVGAGSVEFVLVFDGAALPAAVRAEASGSSRVQVRFSRPPAKADDLIRSLVEEWAGVRAGLTVVTSDLEVANHARACGASVVLSDVFAASLFAERTEERLRDLARGGGRGPAGPRTGSPTAEGSDAEAKPAAMSKREREEWMQLFQDQQREAGFDDDDAAVEEPTRPARSRAEDSEPSDDD